MAGIPPWISEMIVEESKSLSEAYFSIRSVDEYETAIKTNENVVCHFYEQGHLYSEQMYDFMQNIVKCNSGTTLFAKICAEENPELVRKLEIKKIPTIALIKNGQVVDLVVVCDLLSSVDEFDECDMEKILYDKGVIVHVDEKIDYVFSDEEGVWSE